MNTRDEELIQYFETQAGTVLDKAQELLTTALPGGVGTFAYVVVSNLVGKLFGNTKEYVENAINRPVTLPNFIYVEPLDEELEVFFEDPKFVSVRKEFPEKYESFSDENWQQLRRYYKPLYLSLYTKNPFVTEMFKFEIQSQNYKRIITDFPLLPAYKKTLENIPSAPRKNALWTAVNSILKDTVQEVWTKDYAKQLFETAKAQPEVIQLIENIKSKVGERVDIEKVKDTIETIKYATGRAITPPKHNIRTNSMHAVEVIATVSPEKQIIIPSEVIESLHLEADSSVRVLLLVQETW